MPSNRRSWLVDVSSILREHGESLVLALVLALLIRFFVVSAYWVRSDSMAPTFIVGDFVLAYRIPFGMEVPFIEGMRWGARPPRYGELVVFNCPGDPRGYCLKRVVGLPGDRLEMINQRLGVNGVICKYESPSTELGKDSNPVELFEDCQGHRHPIRVTPNWERESWGPKIVPPGRVFVLNDNRSDHTDSRHWGPVDVHSLRARAQLTWLSFEWGSPEEDRLLPRVRWQRVFRWLD